MAAGLQTRDGNSPSPCCYRLNYRQDRNPFRKAVVKMTQTASFDVLVIGEGAMLPRYAPVSWVCGSVWLSASI